MTTAIEKLRKEMMTEAKAYNRFLTEEYLQSLSTSRLIGFCHPIYIPGHISKLEKIVTEWEKEQKTSKE